LRPQVPPPPALELAHLPKQCWSLLEIESTFTIDDVERLPTPVPGNFWREENSECVRTRAAMDVDMPEREFVDFASYENSNSEPSDLEKSVGSEFDEELDAHCRTDTRRATKYRRKSFCVLAAASQSIERARIAEAREQRQLRQQHADALHETIANLGKSATHVLSKTMKRGEIRDFRGYK
jgi:hypothetical protein